MYYSFGTGGERFLHPRKTGGKINVRFKLAERNSKETFKCERPERLNKWPNSMLDLLLLLLLLLLGRVKDWTN
jgi:hypothetical protein